MQTTDQTPWRFKRGQIAWNKGTGKCRRGHDPKHYKVSPAGIGMCLQCKRENGSKYRHTNRKQIRLKKRVGRYSISYEYFQNLWDNQHGSCAICGKKFESIDSCKIDHDHSTNIVRGLLCGSCNTGIGLFKDNPSFLTSASRYLSEYAE